MKGKLFYFLNSFLIPIWVLGQSYSLTDYLPYGAGATSTLGSDSGFTLEIEGTSSTEFSWIASGPDEGLREDFRLDGDGLALFTELGLAEVSGAVVSTETFDPDWVLAPSTVTGGQIVNSTGSYSGSEPGENWTGTTDGTFTVGAVETVVTPAGDFDALKLTFVSEWEEVGGDFTGNGTTTQIWWVSMGVGVVKLEYDFTETYVEGLDRDTDSGNFVFLLESFTAPDGVHIPDENLEAALRDALGKPDGVITSSDLLSLTRFSATDRGIVSLVGLEGATNLTELDLTRNLIVDISPIASLVNLVSLTLNLNIISDLAPLAGLNKLETLLLRKNAIVDLSPISGLSDLGFLWLGWNAIADITPLAGLTELIVLELDGNTLIDDISIVNEMTGLVALTLADNRVGDVSPVASIAGLRTLRIDGNHLIDIAPIASLEALRTVTLQNNYLDINPGTNTRNIIDNWIANGASVTFTPQFLFVGKKLKVAIGLEEGNIRVSWASQAGISYIIQTSGDLNEWFDTSAPISGTGAAIDRTFALPVGARNFYRVLVSIE